jgi:hypothetical protein
MNLERMQAFQAVRDEDIRRVVADPEWQRLRASMVGTWMGFPYYNVARLRKYLGAWDDPMRLRRVLNYLTGSGFRSGAIQHAVVTALRNEVRAAWVAGLRGND